MEIRIGIICGMLAGCCWFLGLIFMQLFGIRDELKKMNEREK